ncbi:MAG: glutaredoxin domain-containing protein [Polyangiaceae bacterium]
MRARGLKLTLLSLVVVFGAASALSACSRRDVNTKEERRELPPLEFRDDTPDLVITYIDDAGATHVVSSPKGVPDAFKNLVRVDPQNDTPTADPIYVADLGDVASDGHYTARSFARDDWERMIEERRRKGSSVADASKPQRPRRDRTPKTPSDPATPSPTTSAPATPNGAPSEQLDPRFAGVNVIVYGASWCGACHDAVDHLHKRGVRTTFKDIGADESARVEMNEKLAKASGRQGAIPVIDVGGKILVGYSAHSVDAALESVRGTLM